MAKTIKIEDLPEEMEISGEEMRRVMGGYTQREYTQLVAAPDLRYSFGLVRPRPMPFILPLPLP
jgi:hypothetical protein